MTVTVSVAQFLDAVTRSGLLNSRTLDAYLQQLRAGTGVPEAPELAKLLVRDGLLTRFQVDRLLAGKHRGFVISGRYKVLDSLGAGGMGAVYLCEHMVMRHRVALKILPVKQARDSVALERFHREARAIAALNHPNIVRALEMDHEGDLHFLVLEHVPGISLQELVKARGPLEPAQAACCVFQAAQGLQHAHEAGLVHRDIKPANLLLDRTGIIKVLDLGLARFFNDEQDRLTQEHDSQSILGTADYLAPEQAVNSHEVDTRADIYSLGCTFYFLLSGRAPFQGKSVTQKLAAHQMQAPEPIRTLRPQVPAELAAVLGRMIAKVPAERFQTPAELAEALRPWAQALMPVEVLAGLLGPQQSGSPSNRPSAATGSSAKAPTPSGGRATMNDGPTSALSTEINLPHARKEGGPVAVPSHAVTAAPPPRVPVLVQGVDEVEATEVVGYDLRRRTQRRRWLLYNLVGGVVLVGSVALFLTLLLKQGPPSGAPEATPPKTAEAIPPERRDPVAKEQGKPVVLQPVNDDQFRKAVALLPVERRMEAVIGRLKQLNPGFDGKVLQQQIVDGQLVYLGFSVADVTDIRPLQALPSLTNVDISGKDWKQRGKLRDFRPLQGLALTRLKCSYTDLDDLSHLKGLRLIQLIAPDCRFRDLAPLEGMPLITMNVSGNPCRDLTPLKGMKLVTLYASNTQIADLAPLAAMPLRGLGIDRTQVRDLSPLKAVPLEDLRAGYSAVSDLTPLRGKQIKTLSIDRTEVKDLSALRGMPLRLLSCRGTPVEDLTPLIDLPLEDLYFDFQPQRGDAKVLRAIKTLQKINGKPVGEFWKAVEVGKIP